MADDCNTSFSVIAAEAVCGSHVLKIDGYSQTKELLETGKCVRSIAFSVGGHNWYIIFYPNGDIEEEEYISVYLDCAEDVKAKFRFNILDKDGEPVLLESFSSLRTFSSKGSSWGYSKFIKKEDLEKSVHLIDDCFTMRCDITVMKEICSKRKKHAPFIVVPPSNFHQHFGDLLKNKDGTDVTFDVRGETFYAHRCVLAARSTVFKAELFGSMKARTDTPMPIEIHDMEAKVFKALLHFIYTDSLSEMTKDRNETHTSVVMAQHLLEAADRYNIERLKLLCEEYLCRQMDQMDTDMVATTLTLAEQHSCTGLKEACINFLASPINWKAMMTSDCYGYLQRCCPSRPNEFNDCNTSSSVIVAESVSGSHVLKIDGYSRTKELLGSGKCVESIPFSVGGHRWCILFYPNGHAKEDKEYISVSLRLDSTAKDVKAKFRINLLDKDGTVVPTNSSGILLSFSSKGSSWCYSKLIKEEDLEKSVLLSDDCFTIKCDIAVMKEISSKREKHAPFIVVPPSNFHQHFGDLLNNKDGTDVTFDVSEETFYAHRCVLAARSTVFKEELFGSMKAKIHGVPLKINDMEGEVFKSLLHFIYTDSLSETTEDSNETHRCVVMTQDLLVAAVRYNIERLKLLCEEKLCKQMDFSMVATSLTLAKQYSCSGLKEVCFDFLASPSKLKAMMESDGYDHLQRSCPSLLKELISRFQPL